MLARVLLVAIDLVLSDEGVGLETARDLVREVWHCYPELSAEWDESQAEARARVRRAPLPRRARAGRYAPAEEASREQNLDHVRRARPQRDDHSGADASPDQPAHAVPREELPRACFLGADLAVAEHFFQRGG